MDAFVQKLDDAERKTRQIADLAGKEVKKVEMVIRHVANTMFGIIGQSAAEIKGFRYRLSFRMVWRGCGTLWKH